MKQYNDAMTVNPNENLPEKAPGSTRVTSYNIAAHYFDSKDTTDKHHHHWAYREPFVYKLLDSVNPDVLCAQELSPDQALALVKHLGPQGYSSVFLSQTPSDIPAGVMAYGEDVGKWCGKNVGTPLVGTFVKSNYKFLEVNRFWLNRDPDQVPTDKSTPDKGFGNKNTYRAVLWTKVQGDGDKELLIFNSHYPLSAGNKTRLKCAKLEMAKIQKITSGANWVSAGDRNLLPIADDKEQQFDPNIVHEELSKHNLSKETKHYGVNTTWLGFTHEGCKNQIKDGKFTNDAKLDVIVSNVAQQCTFSLHGAFDIEKQELLPLLGTLTEQHNSSNSYASDHTLIGTDLVL